MATTTKQKKVVVKGIEHGLSGYTNYGCRCGVCSQANREHAQEYRARRFAGSPLCIIPQCPRVQSRAYGNGLCAKHWHEVSDFRQGLDDMSRLELKRLIKDERLDIRVLKRYTDNELRDMIEENLGMVGMAEVMEDVA